MCHTNKLCRTVFTVIRGDWRVLVNRPPKSGRLLALHTDTLSFISIDTSFLASTHAQPSIAIKYTIVFDQYFGLGPSSGSIFSYFEEYMY